MNKIIALLLMSTILINQAIEFKLGIENIPSHLMEQYAKRHWAVGLVTNQTGIDQHGNRSVDVLVKKGFTISAIFAPEHGFEGKVQAEKAVNDAIDTKTKIPIISLYQQDSGKKISSQMLQGIDALFFDIQDSGMRHYTYISTLLNVLKAAAQEDKKVVVFDRPNPLGKIMEGPLVDPGLISFISIAAIPLRHGMTMGELAEYFNKYVLEKKADLQVVPMKNYDRAFGLNYESAPLSPNIACKASCHGYSFLGLLGEVRPFDVGVGTAHAFQLITLPESLAIAPLLWQQLAVHLKSLGIASVPHRYFNERKQDYYHGLRIEISNINQVCAFNAFIATVLTFKNLGIPLQFNTNFDKAIGSKLIRSFFDGTIAYSAIVKEINVALQLFFKNAQTVFKYVPHPEVMLH